MDTEADQGWFLTDTGHKLHFASGDQGLCGQYVARHRAIAGEHEKCGLCTKALVRVGEHVFFTAALVRPR